MTKKLIESNPALQFKVFSFGQAGNRIADRFASYKTEDGKQAYECFALNSNSGDLRELKNIPSTHQSDLNLGGLGKNPEAAMRILNKNEDVQHKMHEFLANKVTDVDDLVLFTVGLGGGTGTSTIVKAIEQFNVIYNMPKLKKAVALVKAKIGQEKYEDDIAKYNKLAFELAQSQFVKIGIIAVLPVRNDGPDVLRQVNKFAMQLWDVAQNPKNGVAFVTFADNQLFYDNYKKLSVEDKNLHGSYRDYANTEIADTIHEINALAGYGGASLVMDKADLKRSLTEGLGCLSISRYSQQIARGVRQDELKTLFKNVTGNIHGKIATKDSNGNNKEVHHVSLMANIDIKAKLAGNGGFMDEVADEFIAKTPIKGTVFKGYVESDNDRDATAYVIFKTNGLPPRLETGLVEEYEEHQEKMKKVQFSEAATIAQIDDSSSNKSYDDIDWSDLMDDPADKKEQDKDNDIDLDDLLDALDDFK
ncbi:cell division protein FtsZ [Bacillus sp. Hm123]|uniref:cell division protein FtsZ n=1 Tax=Bacillus sp. Hm123 TaxID=3450745 RepID=UPI003F4365AF